MVGYAISAAVFGLLLGACLTFWRQRLFGSGIAVALFAEAGSSIALCAATSGMHVPLVALVSSEYLRALGWAFVLTRCLRTASDAVAVRRLQTVVVAATSVVVAVELYDLVFGLPDRLMDYLGRGWLWGAFALAVVGLVLIEQVARNTRAGQRTKLMHVWLAIGALYAWDLCVFSALISKTQVATTFWDAGGYVDALFGALLAIGLGRISQWESATFLSPRVVFFNVAVLGVSLYVMLMAATGYIVKQYGGAAGATGQIILLAAGTLLLAIAVLSERFRSSARVILAKHLFPYRYDYRNAWQNLTRALSETGEAPVHERIANVLAGFLNASASGLWLREPDGTYVPAGGALASHDAPRESGYQEFFNYLREKEWICDLDETRAPGRRSPRFQAPEWMVANRSMWLVVPLICERSLVGIAILGQPLTALRLSWEEIDLLRAAGRQVGSFLAFEQAAKRLAEAHQFEAVSRLAAVLMHDLRHLVAQQALVVQNAQRHRGNPEFFDDAILTIDSSVKRMMRLMDELRHGALTEQSQRTVLSEICAEAIRRCSARHPVPLLHVQDRGLEVVANADHLLRVIEHVIRNGQDATPLSGSINVAVRRTGQQAVIEIADTGVGMDREFVRTRLFRPFNTTKGTRGFGIGAYDTREFVRNLGGSVDVETAPGKGTKFTITLPFAPELTPAEVSTQS